MKIDLTPAQVKLLETILGPEHLGAIGMSAGQQKTAHTIRVKLLDGGQLASADALGDRTAPISRTYEPLHVLKLTPSYRHSDK